FKPVKEVYICFNRNAASDEAAKYVQAILPRARIAHLPSDVGTNGAIIDFFVNLQKKDLDFEIVLAGAVGIGGDPADRPPLIRALQPAHKSLRRRAERLRKDVSLYDVVSQFTTL